MTLDYSLGYTSQGRLHCGVSLMHLKESRMQQWSALAATKTSPVEITREFLKGVCLFLTALDFAFPVIIYI